MAKRVRDSRDQLYGIARFMAHGGVTLSTCLRSSVSLDLFLTLSLTLSVQGPGTTSTC